MSNFELDYVNLVTQVLNTGEHRQSRAGFTISSFGAMFTIGCLEQGRFPILTQRKMFPQSVFGELAAFLRGAQNLQAFKDFGCNYWDTNAANWGYNLELRPEFKQVGKIYGYQWRYWNGHVDQLADLVFGLKTEPYSRRHLLTTYNPAELEEMCLPPCHLLAQFNVRATEQLDCIVTMRSVDLCLGLPSDIILYATLMLLLCNEAGYTPGKLVFMLGDAHVYRNHIDTFQIHAQRPRQELPKFTLRSNDVSTENFVPNDIELINYKHSGELKYVFNA